MMSKKKETKIPFMHDGFTLAFKTLNLSFAHGEMLYTAQKKSRQII